MKLSDIVQYLNHLDTLDVHDAAAVAVAEVDKITLIVQNSNVQVGDLAADLTSMQQDLRTSLTQYDQKLKQLRHDVQALIEQHEPEYFAESTTRYQEILRSDMPDRILARTPELAADTQVLLQNRLNAYSNWQYPGMVIRPAKSPGLESLVAFDPLYLVDTHEDLFNPVRSLFTPEYQRRLRYYLIREYNKTDIFADLPQTQFGFVYAFHYFEYKPLEIIQQYLDEIFLLLRPGGTFLFSFNDCDQWRSVGSVEHYSGCYTPGRLIRQHIQSIGYKIVYDHCNQGSASWLELQKPGELDSIRGAQAVAGVFRSLKYIEEQIRLAAEAKRIKEEELLKEQARIEQKRLEEQERAKTGIYLYNKLDLDQLIKLSRILRVDISEAKTKREFNVKKVRRTISAYLESVNFSDDSLWRIIDAHIIDKTSQELYNKLNLDQLIKLAKILNVDISEDVTNYNLDFDKVRRTISTYIESTHYSEEYLRQLFKIKENP